MKPLLGRAGTVTAVVIAFMGGLIVAAGSDIIPFGHAQQQPPALNLQAARPLAEASNAFVAIAEHVTPAVVSVQAQNDPVPRTAQTPRERRQGPGSIEDLFGRFPDMEQGPDESSGSGFFVSTDGYILTNNHVITKRDRTTIADRVVVRLNDGRVFRNVTVVGNDPDTDVALLKIEGTGFHAAALGDDVATRIGEWVIAIGNPMALDFTVTAGIISAKGRNADLPRSSSYSVTDFIQTDAAINPGNSGGPLVNARGEVIGINSAIISQTGTFTGYGFAIPITLAKDVMDHFIKYGRVRAGILGVSVQNVTDADAAVAGLDNISGVLVQPFPEGGDSPAQRAGIAGGDVIVAVNGQPIDRVSTLQRIVRRNEPGTTLEVDVMRYGTKRTFKVRLVEAEAPRVARAPEAVAPRVEGVVNEKLGMRIEAVSAELAREANLSSARGVRVAEVAPDSPASGLLAPGDIIMEVLHPSPRREIRNEADLRTALARLNEGDAVSLLVKTFRGDPATMTVVVRDEIRNLRIVR